jgi:dynein heavy chain 1
MVTPDKELIARVKLYSQGFKTAEQLSGKIVSLFDLCLNQLSAQSHYDFGLRALKSVLVSAGNLKRAEKSQLSGPDEVDAAWEQGILLRSLCGTLVPKLVAQDIPLLESLLSGVFPSATLVQLREERIRAELEKLQPKYHMLMTDRFAEKVLQLHQILNLHHGVMMVGPTGCGKSLAWRALLEAMERADGIKGEGYVIDPKAISKEELYGRLDSTTAEWTDGVFTQLLRKVIDNHRGEAGRRHWIVFDGDVDPEWAENLNSVLDDNKLLTLPSGERL